MSRRAATRASLLIGQILWVERRVREQRAAVQRAETAPTRDGIMPLRTGAIEAWVEAEDALGEIERWPEADAAEETLERLPVVRMAPARVLGHQDDCGTRGQEQQNGCQNTSARRHG
jgi:hypothetical protein